MIIGNIFLGMGISIFKFAGLGNDPYSGMMMGLSDLTGITYAPFQVMANFLIFLLEIAFGRELIGIGTIINACFLGYIVTFFYEVWVHLFTLPEALAVQILSMLIGTVIIGFGISMYQVPNAGVSPYDSLSVILAKRMPKIGYFWCRIFTDAICAIICFLSGGIIGLGTLVSAFGLGPGINFFNKHFTRKLFREGEDIL